jgi:hypothetical protein
LHRAATQIKRSGRRGEGKCAADVVHRAGHVDRAAAARQVADRYRRKRPAQIDRTIVSMELQLLRTPAGQMPPFKACRVPSFCCMAAEGFTVIVAPSTHRRRPGIAVIVPGRNRVTGDEQRPAR